MKYGKIIKEYNKKIINIKDINITNNSIIQYKICKKIIKNIMINDYKYSNNECCICMEELGYNYITLKCSHSYHLECIIKLLNSNDSKCCLCRKHIPEYLPINPNDNLILQFITILVLNIYNINITHNTIKNNIKVLKSKANCLSIFRNNKIKKLCKYLNEYDEINRIGITKILKKFKKKVNLDLSFILQINKLVIL